MSFFSVKIFNVQHLHINIETAIYALVLTEAAAAAAPEARGGHAQ